MRPFFAKTLDIDLLNYFYTTYYIPFWWSAFFPLSIFSDMLQALFHFLSFFKSCPHLLEGRDVVLEETA